MGSVNELLKLRESNLLQARRNQGSWGAAASPPPPRPGSYLSWHFYKLTMIVKRKKEPQKDKPDQIPRKLVVTLLLSM